MKEKRQKMKGEKCKGKVESMKKFKNVCGVREEKSSRKNTLKHKTKP